MIKTIQPANTYSNGKISPHFSSNLRNNTKVISSPNYSLPSFGANIDNLSSVKTEKFQKYKQAQKYVDKLDNKNQPLIYYDFDKLEGIQYGIKVFDGVNIKQIALMLERLNAICTSRTCSNGCVHCYADAKPFHVKKDDTNTITKMCWEDFCDLTEGINTLAKRMHTTPKDLSTKQFSILVPFVDADSMEIVIKDKNNHQYDMIDIAKKAKKDLGVITLFDTIGWNHKDPKAQARAGKYVNYIKKENDNNSCDFFTNISLNPFHKLNSKYVEYVKSDPQRAEKFRNLYTDRMANTFYTFSPILDYTRLINRALDNEAQANSLYKKDAHIKLIQEIRDKLVQKYENDTTYTKEEKEKFLENFDRLTEKINTKKILISGRLETLFDENDQMMKHTKKMHSLNTLHPQTIMTNTNAYFGLVFIDANGKVYVHDQYNTVPTDIQLNFRNKNKKTPPIFGLIEKQVSTDDLLEDLKSKNYLI